MIKPRIIILGMIVFLFSLLSRSNAAEMDWKSLGQFNEFIHYYSPASVSHPTKDIVRLWTKEECADKNKCRELHKKWIKESKGQLSPAYERWAYRINSTEMHCKNNKMRFLSVTNVDDRDRQIDSDLEKPTEWIDVKNPWNQPDPYESLYRLVCK
jgi:hypothetical protein